MRNILFLFLSLSIVSVAPAYSESNSLGEGVADVIIQVLKAKAAAKELKLEPVPVDVRLRAALMSNSYVAIFNTTVKEPVVAQVTWASTSGSSARKQLMLDGVHDIQLGHMEGFPIRSGDTLVIEGRNYKPRTIAVQ